MDNCTPSTMMSPPKKRSSDLGHLSSNEKQCILNMYKQQLRDEPDKKISMVVFEISKTLGIANSTVYRTIKEYKTTGSVIDSPHHGGRPAIITNFDEGTKNSVRQLVHAFFFRNELPTIDKVLTEVKERSDLPKMSRSSLYKFIKSLNFRYLKRNRKSILIERDDIVRWRRTYLKSMKQYRNEGRPIYYLDETWVNEGYSTSKVWVDSTVKNKRQAFIEGLSTGLKNPSGRGRRIIILHVGGDSGFVEDSLLPFEGKKSGDNHEEMNSTVFEEWFSKLLTKLPENAIIVMDNASYHSRKLEKISTSSSKKSDMHEWLRSKGINLEADMVRPELLHLIRQHKDQHNLYVTDESARSQNKTVLRLPPYHCELNPMELIWAQVKGEVAAKNKTFKLKEVKELFIEALSNVSSTNWKNCVEHIKEENKMCKLDGIVDNLIEQIIIPLNDSDSMSSEEEIQSDDI